MAHGSTSFSRWLLSTDTPVANTAQLLGAVAALKPQSEAAIGVQRGGEALQLTVTVAQRPRAQAPRER